MVPEIDIWPAAKLMLKRYGDVALKESAARADELVAAGNDNGVAVWRRIIDAVGQLANTIAGACPLTGKGRSPSLAMTMPRYSVAHR